MRDKLLPLLLAAGVVTGCAHQAATPRAGQDVRRYTFLMSGTPAGKEIVTTAGNQVTVDYEFNDRGRGPKLHTVMTLDEHSIPTSIQTTGNDYFKSPVEERFSTENGTALWKSASEDGRADAGGFYLAIQAPPELIGLMAKAYLANPAQPLALLPSGTASVRKAGDLMAGDQHVTHYEISGLDLTPLDVWLDDQNNLFGFVSPFSSMIREGYESHQKALQAKQDVRSTERLVEIAQRNTHTPKNGTLVVRNARIFDPVTLKVSEPSTIEVRGNRITLVSSTVDVTSNGDTIDAAGKLVLPGLWDMHSHLSDTDGVLDIASGVTGVHDVGNGVDFIVRLRKQFNEGTLVGPRIWMRAIIDGPGPMQAPTELLVSNEAEVRTIIDRIAALGYEGIKIYSSVRPELVPYMTSYAHSKGLRASGHIPAHMTASQAIDAGYDEIHHINMIMLNFWPDVKETNTPLRFTAVGERAPALDVKSPEVQAFITKIRTTDTTVDPTLVVFEGMFVARPGVMSPSYAAAADRMPPQLRRALSSGGGLPVTAENDARYKATFRKMMELTAELHRSGVRLVSGTDQAAGFALHRELELYAEAGIPNAEVLRIATLNSVINLGLEKDLGTVSEGKYADFVIIDGDPLTNMSDIRNVVTVVKDGKVFDSKKLFAEVGVH
jgi:hypothetical protein